MAEKHDIQLKGCTTLDSIFPVVDVVDNLTSDSATRPLSAKQGKLLKSYIDNVEPAQMTVDSALSTTSENPVQNKIITDKINELENKEVTVPLATATVTGGIKIGYSGGSARDYPVKLSSGKAYVTVPWTESKTYTNATETSDGLMSKEDKVKLDGFSDSTTQILTQDEYDTLTTKSDDTIYFIKG